MKRKLLMLILISSCSGNPSHKNVYRKELMYTNFDIVVYSSLPKYQLNRHVNKVWKHLKYLDQELSPLGDGFVGRLNKDGFVLHEENLSISPIVSNFIVLSQDIFRQSQGAFDLTVYPLVRLWGFYIQDNTRVPSQQEITDTLHRVGMSNVIFTNDGIALLNDTQLDLGAIAKGYAVDVAVAMLSEIDGINAGIVNAGGNLRVFGQKPDGSDWKVGIRNPSGGDTEEVISLYDGEAIATSGDYERFFESNGNIYHHIFDPATGYPVTHNLASVSVIVSNSAELSDILATTALVLGKVKGKRFITDKLPDVALFFISRYGSELKSEANLEWQKRKK